MHLKIHIEKGIDGYNSNIPTIKGCETWAKDPDEALDKVIELLQYYLKKDENFKYKLDQSFNSTDKKIYTIVFDK